MEFAIDTTDKKILGALLKNARTPLTTLAKQTGVSREVITYRMKRLQQQGVILGFYTEIDVEKLGFVGGVLFVAIKTAHEKEFKQYILKDPAVSWGGEHVGIWDYGMSIYGRTHADVDAQALAIYKKFKEAFIDHRFIFYKRNRFFYEKLFGIQKIEKQHQTKRQKIDEKDKKILQILATNARADYVELAKEAGITGPAIAQRIKQLEKNKYIVRYSIFLDYEKLGVQQYSVFIANKAIDHREKLLSFLAQHRKVCYTCEYLGDETLEFGIFIHNPEELRRTLREVEEAFPDSRITEISLQREFISVGPPRCIFE